MKELEVVKPIYSLSKEGYYCPRCEKKLSYHSIGHFACGVSFDWKGLINLPKINVNDYINDNHAFDIEVIDRRLKYHDLDRVEDELDGNSPLSIEMMNYLVEYTDYYINGLKELNRKLKKELKK